MQAFRRLTAALVVGVMLVMSVVPVLSQDADTQTPVLILPVDQAQFLPGSIFDMRVEVHADELPADFAITIDGQPAIDFFGVTEAESDSYTFGDEDDPTPSQATILRQITFDEPGEYSVEVTVDGNVTSATYVVREPAATREAQNVILFIVDGGSSAVYTATRLISRGMTEGRYNDVLTWDGFEEVGLMHTSGLDSIITDSANSASAYNTGHKSAVNATGVYPDTSVDPFDDPQVETLAQLLKRTLGMSIGIVTTAEFVDATPAAVWAHSRARNNTTRAAYAVELLDLQPEVVLGGGSLYLLPQTIEGSRRADDIDLVTDYEAAGYTIVTTASEMEAAGTPERLAGFFHPGNMDVWLDRNVYTENLGDFTDQPGLPEMTVKALEVLSQNPNGFYLEVEAASTDKALHPMDFERGIADTIEMDRAVAATMDYLEQNGMLENTLIIVTSDHSQAYDVYGTVNTTVFNAGTTDAERRDAIGVYADAGFPTYEDTDGDFYPDNWDTEITLAQGKVDHPDFTEDFQVSPVYRTPAIAGDDGVYTPNPEDDPNGILLTGNLPTGASTSVHTLQDVPVFATGPGAGPAGRVIDNIEIFFIMANALGLDPRNAPMMDDMSIMNDNMDMDMNDNMDMDMNDNMDMDMNDNMDMDMNDNMDMDMNDNS